MSMIDDLMTAIRQKMGQQQPPPPPTLGGLAGGAQRDLTLRKPYLDYVLAVQEQGQTPMPYEQWLAAVQAMQQSQQQGQPQAQQPLGQGMPQR